MAGEGWNRDIARLPGAHILQTWEWGQAKRQNGWQPSPLIWTSEEEHIQAAGLLLERTARLGGFAAPLRVLYLPRGPLLDWGDTGLRARVLDELQRLARRRGAVFIKMDPEVILGTGEPGSALAQESLVGAEVLADLRRRGWRYSEEQIQFKNTVWLDLSGSEADWLARMKQKTRYNLRLAQKKGVTVRVGTENDLDLLYRMYAETSLRDGFVIRSQEYYRALWGQFLRAGLARALVAEVEGEAAAGLLLYTYAGRAWYLFGMSRAVHREKMPNYLLQWEAMRLARSLGCQQYDLWGAPEEFNESDSMWGVYRFKEGLGGEVVRTIGAWDYTARPWLYRLYTQTLPRILAWMRRKGRAETRRALPI